MAPELIRLIAFGAVPAAILAKSRGTLETANISVELTQTPSSTEQMKGLIEGRYDIVSTAFDNILAWNGYEGEVITAVARAQQGVRLPVYARPEINSWSELRGKPCAVDAVDTAFALVLRAMLRENGLDMEDGDYELIPEGATGHRLESIIRGDTYAGVINPPWDKVAEEKGLILLGDHREVIPDYPGGVFATTTQWLNGNRELVARFFSAIQQAIDWARTDSAAAQRVLVTEGDYREEDASRALKSLPHAMSLNPDELQVPLDLRLSFGLGPKMGTDVSGFCDLTVV